MHPFTKQRLQGGLAGIGVMLLLLLLVHEHRPPGDDVDHAPASTSFSAAGDWTASPTARNLLGTGCTCNVQIVGGFNGSRGEPGKDGAFTPGTELPNANLTGDVNGGANYINANLRDARVETSLRFQETNGGLGAPRYVKIGASSGMAADYTIRLPASSGAANAFLQVSTAATGVSTTTWSNTLTSPTIDGGVISGATLDGSTTIAAGATLTGATLTGAKLDGSTTIAAGATITGASFGGTTVFQAGSTITGATLTGAKLDGSTTIAAGATLTGAKLGGSTAFQSGSTITGASFGGTTAFQAGSTITGATLTGAKLDGSTTIAAGATITGASFGGTTVFQAGSTITGATLTGAKLDGSTTIAAGATLTGAKLSGSTAFQAGSTITGASFGGTTAFQSGSTITGATLTGAKLSGSTTFDAGATLKSPVALESLLVKEEAPGMASLTIKPTGLVFPNLVPVALAMGESSELNYYKTMHHLLTGTNPDNPAASHLPVRAYTVRIGRLVTVTLVGILPLHSSGTEPIRLSGFDESQFPLIEVTHGIELIYNRDKPSLQRVSAVMKVGIIGDVSIMVYQADFNSRIVPVHPPSSSQSFTIHMATTTVSWLGK